MTPPTTDTSREAVEFVVATSKSGFHIGMWRDESAAKKALQESDEEWTLSKVVCGEAYDAILAERDAALLREKSLKDNTEELRQLRREFNAMKSERYDLREALDASQAAYVKIHDERDVLQILLEQQATQYLTDTDVLKDKISALRDQLAAARNEALEEVKRSMMGFAHEHADHWSEEFAQGAETQTIGLIGVVDALKSTTPAPREVTVQEDGK